MKFLHLSDLHIGLKLMNRDMGEDQAYVFREIVEIAADRQPDAIVIAGDIYDKAVPSAEAATLFDRFISALTQALPSAVIMMISGNHDSAPRLNIYRQILRSRNVYMIGLPPQRPEDHIEKIILRDAYGPVNFYLLPFVKPSMIRDIAGTDENGNSLSYDASVHRLIEREKIDGNQRNVLVSHQFYLPSGADPNDVERMDSEIRMAGNIDEVRADILERFDYAALGHIHKPIRVGSEFFRYPGTPLACSFSEAGQQKGIIEVELSEKGHVRTNVLPLQPLHGVRVLRGSLRDVLKQGCEDYVSVVLTDKEDLDVIDMQDYIRQAFPNVLEIRRDAVREVNTGIEAAEEILMDPFALCRSYLGDLDEEEQELLRSVINEAAEGNG